MSEMVRRKVLGGRGSMGIVNSLRRQLTHLLNWELSILTDKSSILNLLILLLNSVGSEHFRSMTAIEIIQCLDNVMKVILNRRTRNSWLLLLNNIGKNNVILRDYILYRTLELLKDEDKVEILQNLDAKCIYWKLGNNFLYNLYNIILRDDVENDDIKKCMENCLSGGISPPRELLDVYLRRNSCRDLSLLTGFRVTSNLIGILTYSLSEIEKMDGIEVQDYIEVFSSHQKSLEKKISLEALRNPFSNVISKALMNIIENGDNSEITDGFFHHLSLVHLLERIESFPWNINIWRELFEYLKKILIFLSLTYVLDGFFNTENRVLRNLTINSISQKGSFQKMVSFFRFNFDLDSVGNPDLINLHQVKTLMKSIFTIRNILINRDAYWRYFYLENIMNIQSEMHIVRFQIYSMLVLINHSSSYLIKYLNKNNNSQELLDPDINPDINPEIKLDLNFVLMLSEYNNLEINSSSSGQEKLKSSLFILPVSLLNLLESEKDSKLAFEAILVNNACGNMQNESFAIFFEIWNKLKSKHVKNELSSE